MRSGFTCFSACSLRPADPTAGVPSFLRHPISQTSLSRYRNINLFQASAADTILVAGKGLEPGKKTVFEKAGVRVIEAPLKHSQIDIAALMEQLGAMEISSLLIEGGSQVLASAFSRPVDFKRIFCVP